MPEFIVTISSPDVTAAEIYTSLRYGGFGWYDASVRKYDPEGEVRTTKIQAIKRIRSLLQCSLLDAKFLVDVAESRDSSKWSTVEVDYTSAGFRVIDNS